MVAAGPHRVVVLALDGVLTFELGIPSRIFGSARDESGRPLYEVEICSVDGSPVTTDAGMTLHPASGPAVLGTADTIVIPPTQDVDWLRAGPLPTELSTALAMTRARLVSFCTAAYVLAAAGLLDGRPATTHWSEVADLQQLFPRVQVDPNVLFVDDGDVLTSAGAAAAVDLCLHLVRVDHGSAVANQVARQCVVPPWRDGGQAQFIDRPVPMAAQVSTSATRRWALENLREPLSLQALAAHAHMSLRTFTRKFRDEVGMAPLQWLTLQRIRAAQELLETTDLPIDIVAHHSGFATGNSLRQHLRASLGVSPSTYRRTFSQSRTA
ncbi:helix-turn-helix domain-containing protein [Kribbella sp. NPDC026611]|uniref:GlxA family transcriptional regulator n=1 Tax=Kribbella sp. NPDC026611 TaxID=3154911 RepID=UPI0033D7AA2C